jgi:hypothetical protein
MNRNEACGAAERTCFAALWAKFLLRKQKKSL